MAEHDSEVLVVGAGPVGLLAALNLARRGIDVQIVDEQWRAAARSYALALHPRSLELFGELGLSDALIDRGHRVETIAFYEGSARRAGLDLSKLPGRYPFVLVLPQHALEEVLAQQLRRAGVQVLWNHRLVDVNQDQGRCQARIEKLAKESTGYAVARTEWVVEKERTLKARFVLGADGHRSTVRRCLGIDYETQGEALYFAVFEFNSSGLSGNEMAVVLDDQSTNVLWPMMGGRLRWSFELGGDDFIEPRVKKRLFVHVHRRDFPYSTTEKLQEFIQLRAPWFEEPVEDLVWSATVSFERCLAPRLGDGHCWLLGDAAHLAWPVGVQSMNVGLQEAIELTGRLEAVIQRNESPRLLEGYGTKAGLHWRRLLSEKPLAEIGEEASEWIRLRGNRIPPCLPASGRDLDALLYELGVHLRTEI